MKRLLQWLLGTRFCVQPLCQLPEAPSPSVWGRLGVWSLGSVTGITQPQLDHLSPHLRNYGLGCQGPPPPSLVPGPLLLGLGWTPRFGEECLRTIHFPVAPLFAGGAGFGGWLGVWAGLSPVSRLATSETEAWRVRSHTDGPRLMGQRG